MGQMLAIGIVTKLVTSKKNLQKYGITKDELIAEMKLKIHFEPSIYDFSETDDQYIFELQANVIENQLLPFLEKFYPLMYLDTQEQSDYQEVLEDLRKTEPVEWLKLAEEKEYESFQNDRYGEPDYIYFDKPFRPSAKIFSTSIMLSLEGKILMEEYGTQFNFFKYCIKEAFSEFLIANAVRVYISG